MREASRTKHLLLTAVLILVLAPGAFYQLYSCFLARETSGYLTAVNTRWQLELPTTVAQTLYSADHDGKRCAILTFDQSLAEQPWLLASAAETQTLLADWPPRWQPEHLTLFPARTMTRSQAPDRSLKLIYFDRLTLAGSSFRHVLYIVESGG